MDAPGATAGGTTEQVKERAASAAGTAAEQVQAVAGTATEQAGQVAGQAVEQAQQVVADARVEVQHLASQAAEEAKTQATAQTEKLAEVLRGLATQVQAMVDGNVAEAGQLPAYAGQLNDRLQGMATRLSEGGIDGVVADVQRFARRRPGLFLSGAAAAGFFGGRLLRGAKAASEVPDAAAQRPTGPAPVTNAMPPAPPLGDATVSIDLGDVAAPGSTPPAYAEGMR
jgi:hypothetical protein